MLVFIIYSVNNSISEHTLSESSRFMLFNMLVVIKITIKGEEPLIFLQTFLVRMESFDFYSALSNFLRRKWEMGKWKIIQGIDEKSRFLY